MTFPKRRTGLAAVLLAGTALSAVFLPGAAPFAQQAAPSAITAPAAGPASFADLVERVRPAVVTIVATERAQPQARAGSPFQPGTEQDRNFRRYFGQPEGNNQGPGRGEQQRPSQAMGSGFLIEASGFIVTNNHVVEGANSVKVSLDDGREMPARIVGRDPRTDLALLKVESAQALPHLNLGDSDRARPGDWVIAVGNPFGLGGSVTAGIVSARGRDIGAGPYDDFLQVDAPINRGNSGGPLFAANGDVVGVNTAIFSPSGGSVGIGFAIPSNMVRQVVAQLKENGRVERGFLGASTQPLTPALAQAMHLNGANGALVASVEADSPAAKAGLQAGDVVTAVGGRAVSSPRDLARAIGDQRPGSTVALDVRREGQHRELRVTLAAVQDGAERGAAQEQAAERGKIGIALAPINDATRQALRLPQGATGAVVAEVRPDSPAAEAGLKPGDIITSVGASEVKDPEAAARAIREATATPGSSVALRIIREGRGAFVAVQVPATQG
ncbi:Do family serine endopeptidase [Falsiroseomonas sp. HW251]|uniref:Do family serine endopeptidase n=1 Tax=Falsiroseomonas sp. HW251 TaxID=3390998 RepID=UPI003D31407F